MAIGRMAAPPFWLARGNGIERDRRRIRYVQAFHRLTDWQARERIAMMLDILAHPFALGAEHQRDRPRGQRLGQGGARAPANQ